MLCVSEALNKDLEDAALHTRLQAVGGGAIVAHVLGGGSLILSMAPLRLTASSPATHRCRFLSRYEPTSTMPRIQAKHNTGEIKLPAVRRLGHAGRSETIISEEKPAQDITQSTTPEYESLK